MVNPSKACDPRFWKKWSEASRISHLWPKPNPSTDFPDGEEIVNFDRRTMFHCRFMLPSRPEYPWERLIEGGLLRKFVQAAKTRRKPYLYVDIRDSVMVIEVATLQITAFGSRTTFYDYSNVNFGYFLENGRDRIQEAFNMYKRRIL